MTQKILLVDDDPMLLASMLRCLGLQFDLETALSGPEALEKIHAGSCYAVIVTDMRMPKMDGLEFIRHAREMAPKTIYLMLTGNQDSETANRAIEEGLVAEFLNKPCDPDEIAEAFEDALALYEFESTDNLVHASHTRMARL